MYNLLYKELKNAYNMALILHGKKTIYREFNKAKLACIKANIFFEDVIREARIKHPEQSILLSALLYLHIQNERSN